MGVRPRLATEYPQLAVGRPRPWAKVLGQGGDASGSRPSYVRLFPI